MPAATRGVLPSLKYEDACRIADIIDVMSRNYITTSLQIKAISQRHSKLKLLIIVYKISLSMLAY
jgi:hypothetical protein